MKSTLLIEVDRCLVIPDVHQDITWVERILEKENDWEHLVFLGDYFDTFKRPPEVAGVRQIAAFFVALREQLGDRMTLLLGNHDIHYLEAKPASDLHRNPRHLSTRSSGYSNNSAKKVNKEWSWEFWQNCQLFACVNGYLLSHAGVARRFWPSCYSNEEALVWLDGRCRAAVEGLRFGLDPLLGAGIARGGKEPVGGITWLDWDTEFEEEAVPIPQIVGHTPNAEGARRRGNNWCLDGNQSAYGVLEGSVLSIRRPHK